MVLDAVVLTLYWRHLDHNELDILLSAHVRLRRAVCFRKRPRRYHKAPALRTRRGWSALMERMAEREVHLACEAENSKPHQRALAYLTLARVRLALGTYDPDLIKSALGLAASIRNEHNQPLGLRQLVRVLRISAELEIAAHYDGYKDNACRLLLQALNLAQGAADSPRQAREVLRVWATLTAQ